jgi:hypothetical protein
MKNLAAKQVSVPMSQIDRCRRRFRLEPSPDLAWEVYEF